MKHGLIVKCEDCKTEFEINKYTYKKKIELNESIYCKKCKFKGSRNPNHGTCLCVECHRIFHSEYGYGNNTKDQYDLFLKKCSETIES